MIQELEEVLDNKAGAHTMDVFLHPRTSTLNCWHFREKRLIA